MVSHPNEGTGGGTPRSPSQRTAVEPWCEEPSEAPWRRDKRIHTQKERLEEQKRRLEQRRSPPNNPFEDGSSSSSTPQQQQRTSPSLGTSSGESSGSFPATPNSDLRPFSPRVDQQQRREIAKMGIGTPGAFDPFADPVPMYRSPQQQRKTTNPFDSSTEASSVTSFAQRQQRLEQMRNQPRPRIARPSNESSSSPRNLKKNPKLLVYMDEAATQDSLDQFLDTTQEITAATTTSRAEGSAGNSTTPSEQAMKAAEALKMSFNRPRNGSMDSNSLTLRTPSQSRRIQTDAGTPGSFPPHTPPNPQLGQPTPQAAPNGKVTPNPMTPVTPRESSWPGSIKRTNGSPRKIKSPSDFPSLQSKALAIPEDEEHEQPLASSSLSSSSPKVEGEANLALHDLIDEARTTDDVAWRNALYLLSVQPQLAHQVEPECQLTALHMCCMALDVKQPPPVWMARSLIYTLPKQCQMEDSGGRLPLHLLAATTADLRLMQLLVDEFPASVAHRDCRGFTPLHLLLRNDQIPLTLEHLRILLGQTIQVTEEKKSPIHFRKGEHLKASFEDLQELHLKQQESHEKVFEDYPNDVQQALRKITQWKRRQVNRGIYPQNQLALAFENPAQIATPSSQQLPLHLMARRKVSNKACNEIGTPKLADRDMLVRVLIAAYPEALVRTDANGRTPLLTALLQKDSLPDADMVEMLLGKHVPGFASNPTRSPAQQEASDTLQLPLHVAAEELAHSFEILSVIAEAYPRAVQVQDIRGRTPLHCALQNYRSVPLDKEVFGLLLMAHNRNYEQVAKTVDHDGKRPLDLIIESPHSLKRWEVDDDDDDTLCSFLDASIDIPKSNLQSRELIENVRALPPWLRRPACGSKHVQLTLLEELATPPNTALVLLQGASLVSLLVVLRIALEGEGIDFDSWILVNYFCAYHLAVQLLYWGTAAYLGEFYRLVLSNGWRWIDLAAVCCSIGVASAVQTDISELRSSLNTNFIDLSSFVPADHDDLVATLGGWATGLLWASLVGYLSQWWCGMAVFVGSSFHILRVLFWPFAAAAMGIVGMSQILFTLEDCVKGNICGLSDAYTTVYWMILGEPILAAGDLATFQGQMTTSMTVLLTFFTLMWLTWIASVVAITVAAAHRLDRQKIALRWFWGPKVALTVTSRPSFKETMRQTPTCMQRYCNFMEHAWSILTSSIKGGRRKDEESWDSRWLRPGMIYCTRVIACIVLPIWFLIGLVCLGFLWPPQVRRWVFSADIQSYRAKASSIRQETITAAKLSHLKGEIEGFQSKSLDQNHAIQQDLAQIKALLSRAMSEDLPPSDSWNSNETIHLTGKYR